ncbi:MAG: ABC transporter permease subunit [Acidimicrobiales bacterium]
MIRGRTRVRWVPAAAWAMAGAAMLALAAVVGFLVVGVTSGPLDWARLLTSSVWHPAGGRFGAAAMIWGTAAVAGLALALAAPIGWAAAIAVAELAPLRWRRALRSGCELLAVVPSIVYGLVGIAYVRPLVSRLAGVPGGDSLLAAALVLAVMVLPTIVAVSVDALAAVPAGDREAAAACGLTRSEVIRSAVLPKASQGMGAAALLGLARAVGETIAVFLVVGRADGRFPSSTADVLTRLVRPGQTLTSTLNGPESVLAGTSGPHWAALCALGLILLVAVAGLTVGGRRWEASAAGRSTGGRWRSSRSGLSRRGFGAPRRSVDRAATVGSSAALGVVLALVVALLAAVVTRGSLALQPAFWAGASSGASGGGVRGQIAGTMLLVAAAGLMAAPVGLGLGLVVSEYARPAVARWLRSLTLTLGGVPSILLGLWGYWLFSTRLGWGKSWVAGSIVLAVVAVPPIVVAVAASVAALPAERREAALAMGLRRDQLVRSVVVPQAVPGLVTGTLLGLARAAGETAPLLFTATVFSGARLLPGGVRESPVVALPTHIFVLAQDAAEPLAVRTAWGAAVVLVAIAGLLVLAAAPARRRMEAKMP